MDKACSWLDIADPKRLNALRLYFIGKGRREMMPGDQRPAGWFAAQAPPQLPQDCLFYKNNLRKALELSEMHTGPKPQIVIALTALTLFASAASAEQRLTPPKAGLTNQNAIAVLAMAVVADCLGTRLNGKMIGDLPPDQRGGFHSASDVDRLMSPGVGGDLPVWTHDDTGGLVNITEKSPDECIVSALNFPIQRAARVVAETATKLFPDFKARQNGDGADQTSYDLEMTADGHHYRIGIRGSEPGQPGHELHVSLLEVIVTRQAEPSGGPPAL